MTITDTHRYLLRIRELEWTIWRMCLRRDELQSCLLPAGVRYDKDVVQTSPEDKLGAIAGAVIELDQRIQKLQQQKARMVMEIGAAIEQLDDERERTILVAYYISRKSIKDIAKAITYSESHTYQLRRQGVQHLSAILKDNNNNNLVCGNMVSEEVSKTNNLS